MSVVTLQQVESAEAEAAEAEAARAEAEKAYSRGPSSPGAYNSFEEMHRQHHHLATRAKLMRADFEKQQEATRARAEAEAAAVEALAPEAKKKLAAAWAKTAKSAAAAARAQRQALADAAVYAEALAGVHVDLCRRGLTGSSGQGTTATLSGNVVLENEVWRSIDGASVLARLLADAVRERSPHHPMSTLHPSAATGSVVLEGNEALLAEVRG